MNAKKAGFLEFISQPNQFKVPIYQRTYSWTQKECRKLWDDIIHTGSHDNIQLYERQTVDGGDLL